MAKKVAVKRATAKTRRKKVHATPISVFENLSLKNIRLISLSSKLDITDGKLPNKTEIKSSVSVGPSADGKSILVDGFVITETHPTDPGEKPSTLLLQAHYQCVYEVAGGKALEEFAPFGNELCLVGMTAMWPYFRELIQSVSTKACVPPIILPVFLAASTGGGAGKSVTMVPDTDISQPPPTAPPDPA